MNEEEVYYCLEDNGYIQIGKSNQSGYFTLRIPIDIFNIIKKKAVVRQYGQDRTIEYIKTKQQLKFRRVPMEMK